MRSSLALQSATDFGRFRSHTQPAGRPAAPKFGSHTCPRPEQSHCANGHSGGPASTSPLPPPPPVMTGSEPAVAAPPPWPVPPDVAPPALCPAPPTTLVPPL